MTVWRLITHHEDRGMGLDWMLSHKRIAVGWPVVGDIIRRGYGSAEAISGAIRAFEPYRQAQNIHHAGRSLWNLARAVREDHLVILSGRRTRECVVQVTGPYEYVPPVPGADQLEHYVHQRTIRLTDLDADRLWFAAGGAAEGQSIHLTLLRCASDCDGLLTNP